MLSSALIKRVSWWWRRIGAVSAGIALGLAPLHASAAPAKKPAKAAVVKASAKSAKAPKAAAPAKTAKTAPAPAKTAAKATKTAKAGKLDSPKPSAASGKRVVADNQRGAKTGKTAQTASAAGAGRVKAVMSANARGRDRVERVAARQTRLSLRQVAHVPRAALAPRLSMGRLAGLHGTSDPLDLKSSVALVMDQDTNEVLFSKNQHAVLPIASLTKLMTALIVSDARLPLDEMITITHEDVDMFKGSSSRLPVGATLTRGELMHLALMSSENRAAHALGRTFPGGLSRFVALMNARAIMLGMKDTRFVEPTGLSSANRSSAFDLATLAATAAQEPLLRQFSTSQGYEVAVGSRMLQYGNTNRLVHDPEWNIGLQKTGYISEAGRCLVMQARVGGRKLIMVFLDAHGKQSRLADAERVRRWVETELPTLRTVAGADYSG